MNLKQYWRFFQVALIIQQHPGMPVMTNDFVVYQKVKEKYPGVKITYIKIKEIKWQQN